MEDTRRVQAMLPLHYLLYLSSTYIVSLFLEDVWKWFDLPDICYTLNAKFIGKSGYDYMFDFVIPQSKLPASNTGGQYGR